MRSNRKLVHALAVGAVLTGLGGCSGRQIADDGRGTSGSVGASAGRGNAGAPGARGKTGVGEGGASTARNAPTGGGAGMEGTGGAGTGGGTGVLAECRRSLSESGCPATYDAAIASIDCGPQHGVEQYSLATCGAFRVFGAFAVDAQGTCYFDATGALVGGSVCSKPMGNCNCFVYGSDVTYGACKDSVFVDACATDAGTSRNR